MFKDRNIACDIYAKKSFKLSQIVAVFIIREGTGERYCDSEEQLIVHFKEFYSYCHTPYVSVLGSQSPSVVQHFIFFGAQLSSSMHFAFSPVMHC